MPNDILSGFGVNSPAQPADSTAPAPAASASTPDASARPKLVLRAISAGQIPGVFVPSDAPHIPSDITPESIAASGIGMYRPHTKEISLVLFNPGQVHIDALKKLDVDGKLSSALPSIMTLIGGDNAAPTPGTEATAPAPAANASTPDENLTPVVPRQSTVAGNDAARMRLRQLTGTEPSKRAVPGGGTILNGLLARPI